MRIPAVLALACAALGCESAFARESWEFALFLDVSRAGDRLIAVGERGEVALSSDEGENWSPGISGTTATLTSLTFLDDTRGWACGHRGTLIETRDGGRTWQTVRDALPLDSSALVVRGTGADIVVAGAFGLLRESRDSGHTWAPRDTDSLGAHWYAASLSDDGWTFAGEMGHVITLHGDAFVSELSDKSSLHGLLALRDGTRLAFGLRGSVWRAERHAEWSSVAAYTTQLIACGIELRGGQIILAGQPSAWGASQNSGKNFSPLAAPDGVGAVSALLETNDRRLVCVGENGIRKITLPLSP